MAPDLLGQLEAFVGPALRALTRDRNATEEGLENPDPRLRWAAVVLMTYHWLAGAEFAGRCAKMAQSDPDASVRLKAIGCLGTIFGGTADQGVESLLAGIVSDDAETDIARRGAYIALLTVDGTPRLPGPEAAFALKIPRDVDWEFVRSRARGHQE